MIGGIESLVKQGEDYWEHEFDHVETQKSRPNSQKLIKE